jgi:hypothetical protein
MRIAFPLIGGLLLSVVGLRAGTQSSAAVLTTTTFGSFPREFSPLALRHPHAARFAQGPRNFLAQWGVPDGWNAVSDSPGAGHCGAF